MVSRWPDRTRPAVQTRRLAPPGGLKTRYGGFFWPQRECLLRRRKRTPELASIIFPNRQLGALNGPSTLTPVLCERSSAGAN